MDKTEIQALIDEIGLSVKSEFVPFSKSRYATPAKGEKLWRCLNWRVTVCKGDREILTTDYSAGEAHCPSYKRLVRHHAELSTLDGNKFLTYELETGFEALGEIGEFIRKGKPILPDTIDVLYSLVGDSSVLNYPTHEDWAADFGYDPDSRKGEHVYRQCLEIALKLRYGLGDANLTRLCEAFQDY